MSSEFVIKGCNTVNAKTKCPHYKKIGANKFVFKAIKKITSYFACYQSLVKRAGNDPFLIQNVDLRDSCIIGEFFLEGG